MVVVQRDSYNSSAIRTTLVATLTTNLRLAGMPGNVLVPAAAAGLDEASVLNVTQLATVDRVDLIEHVGSLDGELMTDVDDGLRRVLDL